MLPTMEIVVPQSGAYAANVPAFLAKLWRLVDDPETNHLVRRDWASIGKEYPQL